MRRLEDFRFGIDSTDKSGGLVPSRNSWSKNRFRTDAHQSAF